VQGHGHISVHQITSELMQVAPIIRRFVVDGKVESGRFSDVAFRRGNAAGNATRRRVYTRTVALRSEGMTTLLLMLAPWGRSGVAPLSSGFLPSP